QYYLIFPIIVMACLGPTVNIDRGVFWRNRATVNGDGVTDGLAFVRLGHLPRPKCRLCSVLGLVRGPVLLLRDSARTQESHASFPSSRCRTSYAILHHGSQ